MYSGFLGYHQVFLGTMRATNIQFPRLIIPLHISLIVVGQRSVHVILKIVNPHVLFHIFYCICYAHLFASLILFSKFSAILAHFCLFMHRMLLIYFVASPKDVQLICSTSGLKYWQKSQKSWSIKLNPSTFMPHIPCRYIQNRLICRITISVI